MEELLARYRTKLPVFATLAAVVISIVVGLMMGLELGLLTMSGLALLGVILLLWGSLQSLSGDAPLSLDDALSLAAPPAEEEQKRAVLRALKDLEYERGVGKISDEDYAELAARYRTEAKRLMAQLDESSQATRERAEKLLVKHLQKAKVEPTPAQDAEAKSAPKRGDRVSEVDEQASDTDAVRGHNRAPTSSEDGDAAAAARAIPAAEGSIPPGSEKSHATTPSVGESPATKAIGPRRRCPACGERNRLDARECTACGEPQADEGQRLCAACPAVYEAALDACPECGVAAEAG